MRRQRLHGLARQFRAQRLLRLGALTMRLSKEAKAAVELLVQAGHQPEVTFGKNFKIRAPGIPMIVCPKTSSDYRGLANTIALTRRFIRNARETA